MTDPVLGAVLIWLAHVPFAREVLLQLRTQAELYRQMPEATRAAMPSPPRAPSRIPVSSPRFLVAFRRWIWDASPDEDASVRELKRRMQGSMKREKATAVFGFVVAVGLVLAGWRPW